MKQAEYLRLKQKIKDEYERDLASLDRIYKLSGGESHAVAEPKATITGQLRSEGKKGFIRDVIRAAVAKIDSNFTLRTVRQKLDETPELSEKVIDLQISSALARLAAAGEILVVERGSGKRPSVYGRKTAA